MQTKKMTVEQGKRCNISRFPNFHRSGSIKGMKKLYYGKDALLVRCGQYIYNVTSEPNIYTCGGVISVIYIWDLFEAVAFVTRQDSIRFLPNFVCFYTCALCCFAG